MRVYLRSGMLIALCCLSTAAAVAATSPTHRTRVRSVFEQNIGQIKADDGSSLGYVDAFLRVNGVTAFLHNKGLHLVMQNYYRTGPDLADDIEVESYRVDATLVNSNPNARIVTSGEVPAVRRYILPGFGREGGVARAWSEVTYRDVWPNIDLRLYLTDKGLKYDFIVHPGGDPSQIAIRYDGAPSVESRTGGGLSIPTPLATLQEDAPVSFVQHPDASQSYVASAFTISGNVVRFTVGSYDATQTLIIDPQRVWATYYASNADFTEPRVTIDPSGNVVMAGGTMGTTLPTTPGVLQRRAKVVQDAYVTKFSDAGTHLWSTYYGGSKIDYFKDVTTDSLGNIFAVGFTNSRYPDTNLCDVPNIGTGSTFLTADVDSITVGEGLGLKLNPNGGYLDCWLLGGTQNDVCTSIRLVGTDMIIAGYSGSPRIAGQFGVVPKQNVASLNMDMFILRAKQTKTNVNYYDTQWMTFMGGTAYDQINGIAVNRSGDLFVVGMTNSPDIPVSTTAVQTTTRGGKEAWVGRFNNVTGARVWSTYAGGTEDDDPVRIAIDKDDNITFVGNTMSTNYPTTAGSKYPNYQGLGDGFITQLTKNGAMSWSTYYGADTTEFLYDVACDQSANVWVIGYSSNSTNFETTADAFQKDRPVPLQPTPKDGIIAKFQQDGTMLYASFLGAPAQTPLPVRDSLNHPPPGTDYGYDEGVALAVDRDAYMVFVNTSYSPRFDTTAGAFMGGSKVQQAPNTLVNNLFLNYFSNCKDTSIDITANGPLVLCDNDSRLLLGPTGYEKYQWSTGETSRNITVKDTGSYVLTVTTPQGCRYRDTVHIQRSPKPIANAGTDIQICKDSVGLLNAVVTSGVAPFKYKWNRIETGPEFIVDGDSLAVCKVNPGTTSRYAVTVTDAQGCTGIDTVRVTVINTVPTFAPSTANFGSLDACASSADTTITITNPMPYDIYVSGFVGDKPVVSVVTSLSPAIKIAANGGKADVRVRIAPTTAGVTSGTMNFLGTPCSWVLTVPYTASKAQLTASANPSAVTFRATASCENTKVDTTISIDNNGTDDLTLKIGIVTAPFSIVSPTTDVVVPKGGKQAVVIHYEPTAAGVYSEIARFPFIAGACNDTIRVNLNARRDNVQVQASLSSVTFPELSGCEDQRDTTIVIRNTSSVPVTITPTASSADVVLEPATATAVAANDSLVVKITFRPATQGSYTGSATFTAEPCNIAINVAISGSKQGISFATPASLDLGRVRSCSTPSTTTTFSITYNGTSGTGSVESVVSGANTTTTLTAGAQLPIGQAQQYSITWTPTVDGAYVDSLVLVMQPCSVRRVIRLTGIRSTPSLTSQTPTVAIGAISGSATGSVTYVNSGTDTLRVGVASVSANTFIVATTPANLDAIPPGGTIKVDYQVNCASRATVNDTIVARVLTPCTFDVPTVFTGTCSTAGPVATTVKIDSVQAKVGETISVPLRITASSGLISGNARSWKATVAYLPSVLVGVNGTQDCWVSGQSGPCTIDITGQRGTDTIGVLTTLKYTVVLGDATNAPLTILSFEWTEAPTATITRIPGNVTVNGICEEGGTRLLRPTGTPYRVVVAPNPASDQTTVMIDGLGSESAVITLYNMLGQQLYTATVPPDANGSVRHSIDLRTYGSGIYGLNVTARGTTSKTTLIIAR
ncbi:MAG: SBBP repeat-containing protein [Bacteroidetes bacterium]|nr:SBBP repeat-containing protein [Bacteroidota bacterium]